MKNEDNTDIDYLHPDGKPEHAAEVDGTEKFDGRELEAAAKREKNARIDADGHHICSAQCQKKHKVKI